MPVWLGPALTVGAVVAWCAFEWRAELTPVTYLNDSSVHEQMVRFASSLIGAGHLPLSSWFPFLGLGSPQFLHYQSLGAMLAGLVGLAIGPDSAFRWSLFLALVSWPISVYLSARLFSLSRAAACLAAVASPLVISVTLVGYEPGAYIWVGYGLWTQLLAMWTLPLAWGFTWRAMASRRYALPAVGLVALTAALHFETGYLALIPIGLFPFVRPTDLRRRLVRALVVAVGSLAASAWVTVPLILNSSWAATNEVLAASPLENGYGAGTVMHWLVSGQVFDAARLPVITVFAGAGLIACVTLWRSRPECRAIVVVFAMSLVLCFGRATFGPLTVILPGSKDLFLRRFMMGAQLAGLYLAGIGAVAVARLPGRAIARRWPDVGANLRGNWADIWGLRALGTFAVAALVVIVMAPAWTQVRDYASHNSQDISDQSTTYAAQADQVGTLVTYMRVHGGGRVYAGMPSNWGENFTVGYVPVFKYIESLDVDEVGYTLRTASLMTDPEYAFDQANAGDYPLFGIHYLILPQGMPSPVPARLVTSAGGYSLWVLPNSGYVRVVDTVASISANRSTVGDQSVKYLQSSLPGQAKYLSVAYAGAKAAAPTVAKGATVVGSPGTVVTESDHLSRGIVSATVTTSRTAVVVLSASYDPGWTVRVDGHSVRTEMVAPALVGVEIPAGTHRLAFGYRGFGYYPELAALLVLTLAGFARISYDKTSPLERVSRLRWPVRGSGKD